MLITTMTYPTQHQEGRSALSLAAEMGHVDVMKDLIERGADVNTQNKVIIYRKAYITSMEAYITSVYVHSDHVNIRVLSLCIYVCIYMHM